MTSFETKHQGIFHTECVKSSHHEVSDSEAELVDQQQREVDRPSAVLRAAREEKVSFKLTCSDLFTAC